MLESTAKNVFAPTQSSKEDLQLQAFFANLARLVKRDLNQNKEHEYAFHKNFDRDKVQIWLAQPQKHEKQLRELVRFLFVASSHFKRAVLYFATLPMFKYTVEMYGVDNFSKLDQEIIKKKYLETVNYLDVMNIEHEFLKISLIAWLEDTFFGYEHRLKDSYFIQILDPNYCQISSIEDGVFNFSFDFSYFDKRKEDLERFDIEFKKKYELYIQDKKNMRWQELDSNRTICIKINENFDYSVPPLSGILESLYDIEDFKQLKKAKTELDNYLILGFGIPYMKNATEENQFALSLDKSLEFYEMALSQLPEQVGALLSPFDKIDAIRVDKSEKMVDTVAEAEDAFYNDAGISKILFNSSNASGAALTKGIIVDEMVVFKLLKQCERWVNRKLKTYCKKVYFKTHFLEITHMNKDDYIRNLKEAVAFGVPVKLRYAVALGLTPSSILHNQYIENDILNISDNWIPLKSSHTISDKKKGNPGKSEDELTESGQITRDKDSNNPDNRKV